VARGGGPDHISSTHTHTIVVESPPQPFPSTGGGASISWLVGRGPMLPFSLSVGRMGRRHAASAVGVRVSREGHSLLIGVGAHPHHVHAWVHCAHQAPPRVLTGRRGCSTASTATGPTDINASRCPECGAAFQCGFQAASAAAADTEREDAAFSFSCWCAALPPTLPVPAAVSGAGGLGMEQGRSGCLCPRCLRARLDARAESKGSGPPGTPPPQSK
jgi:hypothetical protein